MKVGAVVLAAVASPQQNQNRYLADFEGKPTIVQVLDALQDAAIEPVIVVLGTEPTEVLETIKPKLDKAKLALNLAPKPTMTSAFQTGLIVISNLEAVFLVRGDQPISDPNLLDTMVKALQANPQALIVSPRHESKNGYPLLFRQKIFFEILGLPESKTVRDAIHAHAGELVLVDAPKWTTEGLDAAQSY